MDKSTVMKRIENKKAKFPAHEIALVGLMVALIEVCKVAMMNIPNVEMTTFLVIMFTVFYGRPVLFAIPVFILIEGVMFGFGLWWVMYLYAWPLLAFVAWLMHKHTSVWIWSMLSGTFGLLFGFLCSLPYFVIGAAEGGIAAGFANMFSWWIAGIPFDITHGIGNFVIMLVLYHPVRSILQKTKDIYFTGNAERS